MIEPLHKDRYGFAAAVISVMFRMLLAKYSKAEIMNMFRAYKVRNYLETVSQSKENADEPQVH